MVVTVYVGESSIQQEALDRVYLARWLLTDDRRSTAWFELGNRVRVAKLDVFGVDTGDRQSASVRDVAVKGQIQGLN